MPSIVWRFSRTPSCKSLVPEVCDLSCAALCDKQSSPPDTVGWFPEQTMNLKSAQTSSCTRWCTTRAARTHVDHRTGSKAQEPHDCALEGCLLDCENYSKLSNQTRTNTSKSGQGPEGVRAYLRVRSASFWLSSGRRSGARRPWSCLLMVRSGMSAEDEKFVAQKNCAGEHKTHTPRARYTSWVRALTGHEYVRAISNASNGCCCCCVCCHFFVSLSFLPFKYYKYF